MQMGQKIHDLRKSLGMSLEEVGNIVGVGKSTVRKWETGDIANMRRDKIAKLAQALHTTPAYLMGWEDEAEQTEKPAPISESELDLAIFNLIKQLPADEKAREIAYLRERIGVLDK